MEIRFFRDPETGQPHIHAHGVSEAEAEAILRPVEDEACSAAARARQSAGQRAGDTCV